MESLARKSGELGASLPGVVGRDESMYESSRSHTDDGGYSDCGELSMELVVIPDCIDQRFTFRWGMLAEVCDRMVAVDAGVYGQGVDMDDRGVREPDDGVYTPEPSPFRLFFGRRDAWLGLRECSAEAW